MASKKKTAAPAAPQTATVENNAKTAVEVVTVKDLKNLANNKMDGLDANHQVDVLNGLKTYFHDDPTAENKFGAMTCNTVNEVVAIGYATQLVNEVLFGKSPFAMRMRVSQRDKILSVAPMLGITIDTKALPAPDENGIAIIPSTAVTVPKETKEKATKEKALKDKKPIVDPTKIENDTMLSEALAFILVDTSGQRYYDRITRATEFLRSYQKLQASKDEATKTEKLAEIDAKTVVDLLDEVRVLVGECPFSSVGLSHFVSRKTVETGSPIVGFCLTHNASINKKTGEAVDDETIAAMVKVLVHWNLLPKIADLEKQIKRCTIDIENARKSSKKSEQMMVKTHEERLKVIQDNLAYTQAQLELVDDPSMEYVNNLISNLDSEDKTLANSAKDTVKKIISTYYPNLGYDKLDDAKDDKEKLSKAVVSIAGYITNLFLDPLSRSTEYKTLDIPEIKPSAETTAEGEEKEESKN